MALLEPPGYAHTGIVAEAAETIHHGILELGFEYAAHVPLGYATP